MDSTINILCATDDCFAPYCGIMLTSLFENNKNHSCRVFIIVNKPLAKKNTRRFIKLGNLYGQQISFVTIDDSLFQKFPKLRNSLVTYYRLVAADLLPESVNKVLYLDGDLIVAGDLSPIWNTDLSDKAIAAVTERASLAEARAEALHYSAELGYFNAGVILMNLDYWRVNGVGQQCLSFLDNHYSILRFHDQDVLNSVLRDKKKMLPIAFNFQTDFLKKDVFKQEYYKIQDAILEAFNAPCIIHFSGPLKPWSIVYYGKPCYRIWQSYKKLSFWSNVPATCPKRKVLKWLIKRFALWPLGFYDSASDYIHVGNSRKQ